MAEATNVKVYTRFRPFNKRETELGGDSSGYLGIDTVQHTVKLNDPGGHGGGATFTVDHVFDQTAEQEAVYDVVARPTVGDVFEGFNGTIFAYGQTGSGKTHTMMGYVEGDGSLAGLIPRASEQIFNTIASEVRGITFEVSVSYIEVYREVIRDLLDPSKVNLRVRESPAKGVYVDGMTQEFVTCEEEVLQVLAIGDESRAVAATNMNATSSRSHSILIVQVHQKNEEDGSSRKAQLNLVDLAGSEKISKTGATGDTLEEAKKINQSLSALSNVIKGLADGKEHVPYRDSKLTRILQSSLGGNTKTSLITAASPHPDNAAETLSTLRFGQRAKTIKTRVKANEQRSAEELAKIVEKLQVELAQLRGYTAALESKLSEAGIALPSAKESAAAAKSASGGVIDGAASSRLMEEHEKLKEAHRLMQQEVADLKSENDEATAEARQAEAKVAVKEGHLSRFQSLSKRAAAEMKYLRSELHQRSLQRTEAVDAISSLTVSLADAQAEVRQLRLVVSEAAADDEPAAAAAGDDEMAAALKKLAADMTDSQAKLRESYESKVAAVSAENEKLRQQVAGLHVDQELLELRWLSVQVDKLQDAEIAAKKAEGRVVTAESWADERVATAQREAAARVAEASGNFEDKLEAFKKKQQAQTAAQVAEANAKVKLGISKAREVVLKQKAQWAQRMQDVETKASERQREVAEQWEAQLGAAKAAAGAKLTQAVADGEKKAAAATSVAAERAEASLREMSLKYEEQLAEAAESAAQKEATAALEAESRLAQAEASARAATEAAIKKHDDMAAQSIVEAVAEADKKVAAAEQREEEFVRAERAKAADEVAKVRAMLAGSSEAAVEEISAQLQEREQQAAADLAEAEARWKERLQTAEASKTAELERAQADWKVRLAETEQRAASAVAAADGRAEAARKEAAEAAAQAAARAAEDKKSNASEQMASARADARIKEVERACEERVEAAEAAASERAAAELAELEVRLTQKLKDAEAQAAQDVAQAKTRARTDADAAAAEAASEVDVRVEAGVAEVKEQWEEKLAEALAEREEQEAALRTQGRDIVRQQREHLEQKSEEALNALRAELQEELEREREEAAEKLARATQEAEAKFQAMSPADRAMHGSPMGGRIARRVPAHNSVLARNRAQFGSGFHHNLAPGSPGRGKFRSDKVFVVEPEMAYVKMGGKLVPGRLHMSESNLTFKSQMESTLINAKIPLGHILYVSPPVATELPTDTPMYESICGGNPMSIFQVVFQDKAAGAKALFKSRKQKDPDSISVNYVATTDRLGALYLALGPYVGNKGAGGAPAPSKKNRGRRGSLDNGTASVVTPAAMHAQAVAEQLMAQESAVPAGWELRESKQYAGRKFYYNLRTGKSQWTVPEADPSAEAAATTGGLMPWDGKEVSIVKSPAGFGMNIDPQCVVLGFQGEDSAAQAAGVELGTSIARINGRRVKSREDIISALGTVQNGDKVDFVFYTQEQVQGMAESRVEIAVKHQVAAAAAAAESSGAGGGYVSRYRKAAPAAAEAGADAEPESEEGTERQLASVKRSQLARTAAYVKTGFLVMKCSGGFFDGVHAQLNTSSKTGKRVKWKQQYFALSGGDGAKLEIYDDRSQFKQNETPVGTIPLVAPTSGNKLADVTEDKSTLIPNAFTLHSDTGLLQLKVLEAWEDPQEWVALINAAAAVADSGKPSAESAAARSQRLALAGVTSGEPSQGELEEAGAEAAGPSEGVPPEGK